MLVSREMHSARNVALTCAVVAIAAMSVCGDEPSSGPPLRFATFNIEDFPHSERQIDGAFDEIVSLDAGFVAVQEIIDPRRFRDEARERLGRHWDFVHTNGSRYPRRRTGVLYDTRRFALGEIAIHGETVAAGGAQPVLDVRLLPRDGSATVQVLVVHLRCCTEGRASRAAEHDALRRLVRANRRDGEWIVILGDFNATEEADRDDLSSLATAGVTWVTEPLRCSAFWKRADDCPTSRLDHVVTSMQVTAVTVRGACADGCDRRDRCPLYRDQISDHCPVLVTTQ